MSLSIRILAAAAALGAGVAFAAGGHHAPQLGVAHFDVFAEGDTLHLLTGYRSAESKGVALWYRRSTDGGASWSAPVRVNGDGAEMFAPHPGENPQIAARGARVLALWTPVVDGRPGAPVTALSEDGGKTFARAGNPATDGADDYHPLPELGAGPDGFHAVWLHGAKHDGTSTQGVHHALSSDGKAWGAVETIDSVTCECCWNRVVASDDGVGVLYRGGAPRDMKFARGSGAKWSAGAPVGKFDWDFKGCPHTGGALAADAKGKALHALVWTGKEGAQGLYYSGSSDSGMRWSAPQRIGGDDAVDADLALAPDGALDAVWDTKAGIMGARSTDGGKTWSAPGPVSKGGARNRHPRTFATSKGAVTLWLEGSREATVLKSSRGAIDAPAG